MFGSHRSRIFSASFLIIFLAVLMLSGSSLAEPKAAAKAPQLTSADCLGCHDAVKEDKFKASVHGQMFQCVDCHQDVKSAPHETTPAKPDCATCHSDQVAKFNSSVHAKAIAAGNAKAARCADCHGNIHEVLPSSDPKSATAHQNVPKTCGSCHGQKLAGSGLSNAPVMAYQESVHGKLAAGGDAKAAVCSDCHSSHDIKRANESDSAIAKSNVAVSCAKCHADQKAQFDGSIHGKALAKGDLHSATCTDCHGIHGIKRHNDANSPVNAKNQATQACAQCHENSKLTAEFGVAGGRAKSYLSNYHGMAKMMGSESVATCASCHGAHNILPASDPNSKINSANLVQTCASCHPGANAKFAAAKIHADLPLAADIGTKVNSWVRTGYIGIIFGTIGFMLLHNIIILFSKLSARRKGHVHHAQGPRVVVRMTKLQRIQHAMLFITFFTLVFTGFALKYPESLVASLFVNEFVRSWIHRIAGALMIVVSLYHVVYLAVYAEGRKMFMDMLPELKDATDMVDAFKYYLGFSQKKPQFKRFNYAEKMEYWALVWGTFVMAATGLALWFKVLFGNVVPGWWIDVATTIHFYEAILATLAIIVWHFYMVIFDPDTYPINWAWLDGKMSMEHYRDEHGLDSETIAKYTVNREDKVENGELTGAGKH